MDSEVLLRKTSRFSFLQKYKTSILTYSFWIAAVMVHLALIVGIIDINFHSSVVKGLPVTPAPNGAPAKRALLFVADGLRFQTFIDKTPSYLRNVIENKGVWGISHTTVPTESRPGHVALAAGLYEDPNAIFKGWRKNPVDFDSIFNESYATWAWGSPDIISIFTKDDRGHVHGKSYPSTWQDFDANLNQTMRLDSWVFDAYLEWLQSSAAEKMKNQNGVILFLHLLGCDVVGHAKKPSSRDYVETMNHVDLRIKEIVKATETFFGNATSAYVFTADHGMTDWGSHGSGSPAETETPLVAWGAGLKAGFRQDIEQANIAPLIASLIGIPIPTNNEGALPWQYFDTDYQEYIGHALLSNVKQLAYYIFGACLKLHCRSNQKITELESKIHEIEQHLNGSVERAIQEGEKAIIFGKESLSLFRKYWRTEILFYMLILWLNWLILVYIKNNKKNPVILKRCYLCRFMTIINYMVGIGLLLTFARHILSHSRNVQLLFYSSVAIISTRISAGAIITSMSAFKLENKRAFFIEMGATLYVLVILFIGLSYRFVLSIGMLSSLLIQRTQLKNIRAPMFWTSLALCVFPLLPVVEPYPRVYVVMIGVCVMLLIVFTNETSQTRKIMETVRLIVTSLVYTEFIDGRYWMSWIILLTTPLCISCYPTETKSRIMGIMVGFFCPLTLLSTSYEPLFFITLALNLLCWLEAAPATLNISEDASTTKDFTKAALFMLYTLISFFGTGNIASISSFNPSWTRHFVTVFSPFLMMSLILFKLSIPLILIGCTSYVLGSKSVSLAVLFLADCLALPLMYGVTPYGSWLDIGIAISKFIIAISLPCLLIVLQYLSRPLMKLRLKSLQIGLLPEKTHIV